MTPATFAQKGKDTMVSPESHNQDISDLSTSIYDDKLTLSETLEQLEIMIKKKDLKAK